MLVDLTLLHSCTLVSLSKSCCVHLITLPTRSRWPKLRHHFLLKASLEDGCSVTGGLTETSRPGRNNVLRVTMSARCCVHE